MRFAGGLTLGVLLGAIMIAGAAVALVGLAPFQSVFGFAEADGERAAARGRTSSDASSDASAQTGASAVELTALRDALAAAEKAREEAVAAQDTARTELRAAQEELYKAQDAMDADASAALRQRLDLESQVEAALARAADADERAASAIADAGSAEAALTRRIALAEPDQVEDSLTAALARVNARLCDARGDAGVEGLFSVVGGRDVSATIGLDASAGPTQAFPWIASLNIVIDPGDSQGVGEVADRCGATVIGRDWLLTAAHCLTPAPWERIDVTAGALDLTEESAYRGAASQAICHVAFDYKFQSLTNDLALVKLEEPLPEDVPAARIATPAFMAELERGERLQAAGWGATGADARGRPVAPSDSLRSIELEVRDVHGTHVFVGDPARRTAGVCAGDSGGPLVLGDGVDAPLIGVTSYVVAPNGVQCATQDYLSVFTNASLYVDWIEDVLRVCEARDDC